MQTPAEQELIRRICDLIKRPGNDAKPPLILSIGAAKSLVIERCLLDLGCTYVCDRIDVEDCAVDFAIARHCWIGSVEEMTPAGSGEYAAAFANYVLEHVLEIQKAAREIHRVLAPSGLFVASLPNPSAPEFWLARHTPHWFHRVVRRTESWETHYAFKTVENLVATFEANGFTTESVNYWAFTQGYLWRYPVIRALSRQYDRAVTRSGIKRLMGNVCLVLKKT